MFFFAHAAFGVTAEHFVIPRSLILLAWVGVAVCAAYVVLSALTSREMLLDTVRPPSLKKKRHLVLKWVSGIVLLLAATMHCQGNSSFGFSVFLSCLALVLICAHSWIGMRSMVKDLGAKKIRRSMCRVTLCFMTILFSALRGFIPEDREADLPADGGLCYPLETAKGLKKAIDTLCHLP